jgi:hypothetical protein
LFARHGGDKGIDGALASVGNRYGFNAAAGQMFFKCGFYPVAKLCGACAALERIGYNNYVAYHLALPSICLAYDYIWGVAGLSTKYLIIKACGGIMKENKCLHYS